MRLETLSITIQRHGTGSSVGFGRATYTPFGRQLPQLVSLVQCADASEVYTAVGDACEELLTAACADLPWCQEEALF
jgi:hypothetical protein